MASVTLFMKLLRDERLANIEFCNSRGFMKVLNQQFWNIVPNVRFTLNCIHQK